MHIWLIALSCIFCFAEILESPLLEFNQDTDTTWPSVSAFSRLIELLGGKKRSVPPMTYLDPIVHDMATYHHVHYQQLVRQDLEYQGVELSRMEESITLASMPFWNQVKFGHYVTKKMLGEDERFWRPWVTYMIDTEVPVRRRAGTYDVRASASLVYIMAHLRSGDPLWMSFATAIAEIQSAPNDTECVRDENFKTVAQGYVDKHYEAKITDPDFHASLISKFKETQSILQMPFIDQATYGDPVIWGMMREPESIWRPFLEYVIFIDASKALKTHSYNFSSIANVAYIISQLRPADPLWIEAVRILDLLVKGAPNA